MNLQHAVSYRAQVKRLRAIAAEILKLYPFNVQTIEFIKYSANAIFKITDTQNKSYVLRINPAEYHTQQAISEEIMWLQHIRNTTSLIVPSPVKTIEDKYLIEARHPLLPSSRFCTVFEWLPGKKKWKSINELYARNLGEIIATLQKSGQGIQMQHRHYWLSDGLVGAETARLFNVEKLTDVSAEEQNIITAARRIVYEKLKHYEIAYKDKTGIVHTDVQPNNILIHNGQYAVIDFDECGVGFYGDDLAGALGAFEHVAEGNSLKSFVKLREALFNGYSKFMPLSEEDIRLSPYFLLARKLVTIAWLEARKNNPSLRYYFPVAIKRAITFFQALRDCC